MLEVFIARRSRNGVVLPIARSHSPDLVTDVARRVLSEMRAQKFSDEVLMAFVCAQTAALEAALEEEGMDDAG